MPHTEAWCIKKAFVRATELPAKARVATSATSAPRQTPEDHADALGRELHMVQQKQSHQQGSSEGEAMEQDDLSQQTAPPEQEESVAEAEGEIVRPPRGQGVYGCNKDTSHCSCVDRPAKRVVAKEPTEGERKFCGSSPSCGGTCTSRLGLGSDASSGSHDVPTKNKL